MAPFPFDDVQLLRRSGPVEVLSGTSRRNGQRVAVKRLVAGSVEPDAMTLQRFRREMLIARVVQHSGIAACLDAADDWMAFEWLKDGLDDRMIQQRFTRPSALRSLVSRIAETLAYLHGRGVTHADIKPAHIRFRADQPVLIDLGIATIGAQDPVAERELAGSPRWMAPEVIAGGAPAPAADVWSLCAVAAWLANGSPSNASDADTILDLRNDGAALPEHSIDGVRGQDRELGAILEAGLGPMTARPSAANLTYLISRSTAG